jgi:PST family polysaccharide transporter
MPSQQGVVDAFSVEHLHADLKGRSVRAGAQSMVAQVAQILLQSVSTVLLARLLTPVDFGLVAMVTAVTAIAAAFSDLGLTEATIQRKEITHSQVSTLFWINVGMGVLLTLVTAAMAPVLAWFYKEPRLLGITLAVSPTFLIGGLRAQHNALLKRQMRFSAIAVRDVAAYAVAVPLALVLAWYGVGYWALIALPMALNISQLIISWGLVSWRPGLPSRDTEIRSMVGFGGNVAASYAVFNWIRNADNVLIGWYWGAGPLGLYSRAFNLLTLALNQITGPASNVAIPALSRTQSDPELFSKYYLRAMNLSMWIIAALFGFLFVAAKPVIVLVLGAKWVDAAPVFRILAISAFGQMLLESILWLFVSRGQSARLLRLLLILLPLFVASFALGLPFGIKWVALALSIFLVVSLPWILRFAFVGTTLTLGRLGKALACPILLSLAGVVVAEFALYVLLPSTILAHLILVILGFAVVYSAAFRLPPVRSELNSLWKLLAELRLSRRAAA